MSCPDGNVISTVTTGQLLTSSQHQSIGQIILFEACLAFLQCLALKENTLECHQQTIVSNQIVNVTIEINS